MSQNTVIVVDGTGLEVLEYINDAFNTVVTNNSGSSSPTETYAFMTWADTTSGLLKIRNAANTDWVTIGALASTNLGLLPSTAIGTTVQAYDDDLAAIASSNAGAQIVSYATNGIGFKNRIINGDMKIDQRNAGASVTVTNGTQPYTLDRWKAENISDGAFTIQQSSVAPAGFTNSLLFTTTTADASLASGQYAFLKQPIEGFNVFDIGFGAAAASTVTLSFWVRCSLTGTFGGSLRNGASNRSYPFSYTVTSANTWEYKTITIAGYTSGTWLKNNELGVDVAFGLGVGSNFSGSAGSWSSSNLLSATGARSVIGTNGATFYITGVQLEKGSSATPFEVRPYDTELMMCQRYYEVYPCKRCTGITYTPNGDTRSIFSLKVNKRATPTLTQSGSLNVIAFGAAGELNNVSLGTVSVDPSNYGFDIRSVGNAAAFASCGGIISWGDNGYGNFTVYASAEL